MENPKNFNVLRILNDIFDGEQENTKLSQAEIEDAKVF